MRKLVTDARQANAAIPGFLVGFGIDVTIAAAFAIALGLAQQHP